jgi:hypothetical protein
MAGQSHAIQWAVWFTFSPSPSIHLLPYVSTNNTCSPGECPVFCTEVTSAHSVEQHWARRLLTHFENLAVRSSPSQSDRRCLRRAYLEGLLVSSPCDCIQALLQLPSSFQHESVLCGLWCCDVGREIPDVSNEPNVCSLRVMQWVFVTLKLKSVWSVEKTSLSPETRCHVPEVSNLEVADTVYGTWCYCYRIA